VIDSLTFLSKGKMTIVYCTYCWQRHTAHRLNGQVFMLAYCGHDRRRYFLDHREYHAYVDRYRKEGGTHIDQWDAPEQESLPLFDDDRQ
jgi:hypothetical protein